MASARSTWSGRRFPQEPFPARQKSARCKSLASWRTPGAAVTQARSAILDSMATLIPALRYIFLHDNGVRSGRHRRAREDPDRLTTRNTKLLVTTSRLFANHAQPLAFLARACN